MRAVRIHEFGGPEVMQLDELPTPEPGAGQVRVKVEAAGVNFIDIYQRGGVYKNALPHALGMEGSGTVEALGANVADLSVGDRVAWSSVAGSYATHLIAPADKLVKLPDSIDFQSAAAVILQGMTAHYLAVDTYPLKPGDTCLVHAAAGGVGLLLCQIASQRGARVIGTVSTEAKAELARGAGASDVILYTQQDFETEVKRLTDGRGVDVVYDTVGKDTFDKSLNCLRPRGMLVLAGQSSGAVPPLDPQTLNAKGSLYLTRPSVFHYTATRAELLQRAGEVLDWVGSGTLRVRVDEAYGLADAAAAQEALASRKTTGQARPGSLDEPRTAFAASGIADDAPDSNRGAGWEMVTRTLPLFSYGSLVERTTLDRLLGPGAQRQLSSAELVDFEKVWMTGYGYPFVVPRRGKRVVGTLVEGLKTGDYVKLDRYEGLSGGDYRRIQVRVRVLGVDRPEEVDAYVYALGPRWEDFIL